MLSEHLMIPNFSRKDCCRSYLSKSSRRDGPPRMAPVCFSYPGVLFGYVPFHSCKDPYLNNEFYAHLNHKI